MNAKTVKVSSLADLKTVKREIEAQAQREAKRLAELAVAQAQAEREVNLFVLAAGKVQPLPDKRQALLKKERPAPKVRQYQEDE